jgi:hypothetical protein
MALDSTTTVSGAPSLTTSTNRDILTGGPDFGCIVGASTAEPVGFYGQPGVSQQSGTGITTVAELVAALQAVGLLGT